MEASDQIIAVLVMVLFYIDCTATYWSLSVMERFNVSALHMEQNRIARWLFKQLGIKAGYIIWIMFIMAALSTLIYYSVKIHADEILWGLFAMGLIIAQLHTFNYIHIRNNDRYQRLLKELQIKQVKV
ncbi:MAG: hypothetical protein MUP55_03265 [Candidatus Aenigmarchaeota archaeon]|nr:hypothetical protein [Candidatus Aenigmarchaeota archaeon]